MRDFQRTVHGMKDKMVDWIAELPIQNLFNIVLTDSPPPPLIAEPSQGEPFVTLSPESALTMGPLFNLGPNKKCVCWLCILNPPNDRSDSCSYVCTLFLQLIFVGIAVEHNKTKEVIEEWIAYKNT